VSGVRLDEVRNEPKRSGGLREFQLETVVRFLVGTFIGFMDWWMRDENDHLPAEQVDRLPLARPARCGEGARVGARAAEVALRARLKRPHRRRAGWRQPRPDDCSIGSDVKALQHPFRLSEARDWPSCISRVAATRPVVDKEHDAEGMERRCDQAANGAVGTAATTIRPLASRTAATRNVSPVPDVALNGLYGEPLSVTWAATSASVIRGRSPSLRAEVDGSSPTAVTSTVTLGMRPVAADGSSPASDVRATSSRVAA
jgi:hypothetical protein